MTAMLWVLYLAVGVVVALFLGGMLAAAWECHVEKRETGKVTRPGWQLRKRDRPCWCMDGYVCTYCTRDDSGLAVTVRRRSL